VLVFDRLWVKAALQEMQEAFARNLQMLAELFEQSRKADRNEAARRALQLRDKINDEFSAVKSQAGALVFEFGPSRQRKLKIRADVRRMQPALGATAGDRGLLHPELVHSATRDTLVQIQTSGDDTCFVSANRTCELGTRQTTGKVYESFIYALEEATRLLNDPPIAAGRMG
jgi:hypothetical protein